MRVRFFALRPHQKKAARTISRLDHTNLELENAGTRFRHWIISHFGTCNKSLSPRVREDMTTKREV